MADNITVPVSGGTAILRSHDVGSGIQKQIIENAIDQPAATTGSIATGTGTASIVVTNYASLAIKFTGTYTGFVFVFEGTIDGTNWDIFQVQRDSTGAALSGDTVGATGPLYVADVHAFTSVRVRATALASGTVTVNWSLAGGGSPAVISIGNLRGATPAITSVSGSASSVALLAANPSRVGLAITNDSTATLYVAYGATASTTSFTAKLAPNSAPMTDDGYTGAVSGIWSSATGSARITEVTP